MFTINLNKNKSSEIHHTSIDNPRVLMFRIHRFGKKNPALQKKKTL